MTYKDKKKGKERKDRSVLLKRTDAEPCFFYKNICLLIHNNHAAMRPVVETVMFSGAKPEKRLSGLRSNQSTETI